jgi:hypothetical protein
MFRGILLGTACMAGLFGWLAWGGPDGFDMVESFVRSARAETGIVLVAEGMPMAVAECVKSSVKSVSDRFGKRIGSPGSNRSLIQFANGGSTVSYEIVNAIKNSVPSAR